MDETNYDEVGRLAEEYLNRIRAGEQVDWQEYANQYPAHAEEIASQFPLLAVVEGLAPSGSGIADLEAYRNSAPASPQQLGAYRLLDKLGEGGMGTVWSAEQQQPIRRRVALKLIRAGIDSEEVLARFEAERQALAMMNHPYIAKVHDVGAADDGRPYMVMELVRGKPVTRYCDEFEVALTQRLQVFVQICEAVQHAHQKGIVHRDIKPSNVLMNEEVTPPQPKIIDFGLAKAVQPELKLTDRTLYTEQGQIVGTLTYMSPEQAASSPDLDTRTDIYSLGVLLYELLTGTTPIEKRVANSTPVDQVMQMVREQDPPRPSSRLRATAAEKASLSKLHQSDTYTQNNRPGGDLDWIVMKALDKDRERRYESAGDLAEDVRRFLRNEEVQARPPTPAYRLKKFVRRNRAGVLAASLIFLTLLAGMAATTTQWIRAAHLADNLQSELYFGDMKRANQRQEMGLMGQAGELLDKHLPQPGEDDLRHFEWHYLDGFRSETEQVPKYFHSGVVEGLKFFSVGDQQRLAVMQNQQIRIHSWSSESGKLDHLRTIETPYSNEWYWMPAVAISRDGQWAAIVELMDSDSGPRTIELKLIDIGSGEQVSAVTIGVAPTQRGENDIRATAVAFSSDKTFLATGHINGAIMLWEIGPAGQIQKVRDLTPHERTVGSLAFSVDGSKLISSSWDATVRIQSLLGEIDKEFALESEVSDVVISPDGTTVASGTLNGYSHNWNLAKGFERTYEEGQMVYCTAISPDGQVVASGGNYGKIVLRDAQTGRELTNLLGHDGTVRELAFSPEGSWLVSGDEYGNIRSWWMGGDLAGDSAASLKSKSNSQSALRTIPASASEIFDIDFHPIEPILAMTSGKQIAFWNLAGHWEESIAMEGTTRSVEFSPDGSKIVVGSWAHPLGTQVFDWKTRQPIGEPLDGNAAVFAHDGRKVILSRDQGTLGTKMADVILANPKTGETQLIDQSLGDRWIYYAAKKMPVTHEDSILATQSVQESISGRRAWLHLWNLESFEQLASIEAHQDLIQAIAFSPDNNLLATTSMDRTLKVWDVTDPTHPKFSRTFGGQQDWIMDAVFFPDGKVVATPGGDGTVRLWDVESGRERFVLRASHSPLTCIALSYDGRTIAAANRHGEVWLWHAATLSSK